MCAMVMCSMHGVAHVLEAYMLHMNMHTFCMHVFCTPRVLVCGIHVARFNFCVCSTHEKDALYVQHVSCIYA